MGGALVASAESADEASRGRGAGVPSALRAAAVFKRSRRRGWGYDTVSFDMLSTEAGSAFVPLLDAWSLAIEAATLSSDPVPLKEEGFSEPVSLLSLAKKYLLPRADAAV